MNLSIGTPLLKSHFNKHLDVKNNLLSLINQSKTKKSKIEFEDVFHKLDWDQASDFNRPWVKYVFPYSHNQLLEMVNKIGFKSIKVHETWFQQYGNQGTHGWHIHANNFTGVYYLEFDDHQYTQLLDPLNLNKAISLRVIEGDFIVFPSHVIHRSGVNQTKKRRSIISFNFDVKEIRDDLLQERTIKYVY
mgnify:FL=1|jgi:hypothetical protein|tara:strand:- start:4 stop:573 length:570 start_codon:yes stop_codon:yes gene_type:complete